MLKNMQRASTQSSGRRFDEQSWRDPGQGQSINWEFQKHSEGIRLCSIYETAETDLGSSSGLVVDKKSAVMGKQTRKAFVSDSLTWFLTRLFRRACGRVNCQPSRHVQL